MIQSSFFWGYVCTQIIGSIVAQRWGAHKLFSLAQFACGFVTLLIPVLAENAGWEAFCVTRVIAGIFQGTVLPCLHALLSKWAPMEERGRICEYGIYTLIIIVIICYYWSFNSKINKYLQFLQFLLFLILDYLLDRIYFIFDEMEENEKIIIFVWLNFIVYFTIIYSDIRVCRRLDWKCNLFTQYGSIGCFSLGMAQLFLRLGQHNYPFQSFVLLYRLRVTGRTSKYTSRWKTIYRK